MNIRTTFEYPPIPVRSFDWSAVDDDTYDGEGCLIGHGATKQAAIDDLIDQISEREDVALASHDQTSTGEVK
ncbi:hypothetical protein [Tardiphaga sp. 839_C3_N1_4]|uniref:hypothetical protein n=1 Tax=Tardiphaga sp. 839_C3_N1_4 TaxID=3240761 RepID=UPI003F265D2A